MSLADSVPQLWATRNMAHCADIGKRRRLGEGALRTSALGVAIGASEGAGLCAVRPRTG